MSVRSLARCVALFATLVVVGACRKSDALRRDDDKTLEKPLSIAYFSGLIEGKEPHGVHSLTDAEAKKRWHWRLRSRDGVVLEAEQVTPAGRVYRHRSYHRDAGRLVTTVLDAHAEMIAVIDLAPEGALTYTARSSVIGDDGCHHRRLAFDESGRPTSAACLDNAGRPVADAKGCEVERRAYDTEGHVARIECFDAAGVPALFANRDHARRFTYDADGLRSLSEFLDLDDKPMLDQNACAAERTRYDERSTPIATECLDLSGLLVRDTRCTADANGCDTREEKHDVHGALEARDGYAIRLWKRNDVCDITHEEKRDAAGALTGDVPVVDFSYDAHGWLKEETCADASGLYASCQYGKGAAGAKIVFQRDDRGRPTFRRAFAIDGAVSISSPSYPHEFRYFYGEDGRNSATAYFDESGKPSTGNGVHRIAFAYDSVGSETSRRFFDVGGAPMMNTTGCHDLRSVFGDHHLLMVRECRDSAGALHENSGCVDGVCWKGAAQVLVVRAAGETIDVFEDAIGVELRRVSCRTEKCYR